MVTLVDTPGAANANTYSSLAFAATWHSTQLGGDAWFAAPDQHAVALVMATGIFDQSCLWKGARTSLTQALAWPRTGVVYADPSLPSASSVAIPSTIIPVFLQQATAELAKVLIPDRREADDPGVGLTGLRIGPFAFTMGTPAERYNLLPPLVRQLIAPYVWASVGGIVRRVVRT